MDLPHSGHDAIVCPHRAWKRCFQQSALVAIDEHFEGDPQEHELVHVVGGVDGLQVPVRRATLAATDGLVRRSERDPLLDGDVTQRM